MTDETLRNTIVRILHRVHPAPLRLDTLAAECEIALSTPLSKADFDRELGALRDARLVGTGRTGLAGCAEMAFLTAAGQAEAARAFG